MERGCYCTKLYLLVATILSVIVMSRFCRYEIPYVLASSVCAVVCCADYYVQVHVVVSAGRFTWLLRTRILLVVIVSSCFADISYPLCIRVAHLLHYLLLMSSPNLKKILS